MKKSLQNVLLLSAISMLPMSAFAGIIIDNTTQGLYNNSLGDIHGMDGPGGFLVAPIPVEGDPTIVLGGDPGFAFDTNLFGANWLGGDYTGGTWSAGPVAIPATWTVFDETAIVYDFTLATASDLHFDFGIDNGIVLWLDGNFLFGATSAGGSNLNEYDVDVLGLAAGNHSLQVLRADHGGATGYAISVDAVAAAVPEPGILMLLLTGLVGVFKSRKKLS